MGSNATPVNTLSGILIPWDVTNGSGVPGGGDYTCADTRPGPLTPSGQTPLRMELTLPPSVTYPAAVTQLDVMAINPGAPGATRSTLTSGPSAGVAYRVNNAGDWHGADDWRMPTGGMRQLADLSAEADPIGTQPSMVSLSNGKIVAVWSQAAGIYYAIRNADTGAWSTAALLTAIAPANTTARCCLTRAPDGALHVYTHYPASANPVPDWTIAVIRSTDEGTTWRIVTRDVGIPVISDANRQLVTRIRAASVNGGVALFINTKTAVPVYSVAQHVSTDGGYAFRQVVAPTAGYQIVDVKAHNNVLNILSMDSTDLTYRALGVANGSWLAPTGVTIVVADATTPGAIEVAPDGSLWATTAYANDLLYGFRSTDRGATWTDGGPSYISDLGAEDIGGIAFGKSRGTLIGLMVGMEGAGTAPNALLEIRWGGNTNATTGSQVSGWSSMLTSWYAVDTLANSGWTLTPAGAPAVTIDVDANGYQSQKIVTGAAELMLLDSPTTTTTSGGVAQIVIRAAAVGVTPIVVRFGADDQQTQVDITTTQIRAYDYAGAASSWVNHGATTAQYLEVACIADASASRSVVVFRILDNTAVRTFTELPVITSQSATAGTDLSVAIDIGNDTTVHLNRVTRIKADRLSIGAGWTAGQGRPYTLDAVPLTTARTHLHGGIEVACIGGIAAVDGVTQTAYPTSVYRLENTIPTVSPSPGAVWRSGSLADQTITYDMPARDRNGLTGLYLLNMVGIGSVNVTAGLAKTTIALSTTFKYLNAGKMVTPSLTGATVLGPWVQADELKDFRFMDGAGTIRKVTGNTEGSLTSGSAHAEHRARLYLDGTADSATNGTGTLYPVNALLLAHMENAAGSTVNAIEVEILQASNPAVSEGYRQIGAIVAGRVHILGTSPDLNDTYAMDSAAGVQTMPNGERYATRRHNDRRRIEIALANSPHDVRAMMGSSTSPDYVVMTTSGKPAASRTGVPLVIEGIVRRAADTDAPVVWVPTIPVRAEGWYAQTLGLASTIYGRIMGVYRREAVDYVGDRSGTQVYRVPAIVIEEEL